MIDQQVSQTSSTTDPWDELSSLYRPGLLATISSITIGQLPQAGLHYVISCLREPSRNTESTVRNISGKYPSRKLGRSVGFESSTIEYPTLLRKERDPNCVAILDQPPKLKLRTASADGKRGGHLHTPDFLCIERDRITIIECKSLEGIDRKNEKSRDFFVYTGGRWTCPPGIAAAERIGLRYEVLTPLDFDPLELRNANLIDEFLRGNVQAYDQEIRRLVQYMEHSEPRTITQALSELPGSVTISGIYSAIARGAVAFDLHASPLTKHDNCELYRDRETLEAYQVARAKSVFKRAPVQSNSVAVSVGTEVMWNACRWRIIRFEGTKLHLVPNAETLPVRLGSDALLEVATFLGKLKSGEMTVTESAPRTPSRDGASAMLQAASKRDFQVAVDKLSDIRPYLEGRLKSSTNRQLRRDLKSYRDAALKYGNGYVGLLPLWRQSGNRTPRIDDVVVTCAAEVINDHFLTTTKPTRRATYDHLKIVLEAKGYPVPSYNWLCTQINSIPKYHVALARDGRKGSYRYKPRVAINDKDAAPLAERAFELAHIDHTKIDVVVTTDGEPQRLWLTVMICVATRRVLAALLSFDAPSYRHVLGAMRQCVERYGRLPQAIMADGGKEFHGVWFETACAANHVTGKRRPKSMPRFGAQIERLFGTANTKLFYNLIGNTQHTKKVRELTPETDPYRNALYTASKMKAKVEKFLFEDYDNGMHTGLMTSPRAAFEYSLTKFGNSRHLLIRYDETFLILTSGTTRKGTAKVQPDGVKINHLYYNHIELQVHIGENLPVRFDPFNIANAWVQLNNAWIKITSRHASILVNHSEHHVSAVTTAWREAKRGTDRMSLNENRLLNLLREIDTDEKWADLRQQSARETSLRAEDVKIIEQRQPDPVQPAAPPIAPPRIEEHKSRERRSRQRLSIEGDLDELEVL